MEKPEQHNNEHESENIGQRVHWVIVGEATNGIEAEFAINGLKSYDIPAKLDNRPGVLGSAGLAMRSIFTGQLDKFKILVPGEFEVEARELVKMFLGDKSDSKSEDDDSESTA